MTTQHLGELLRHPYQRQKHDGLAIPCVLAHGLGNLGQIWLKCVNKTAQLEVTHARLDLREVNINGDGACHDW